MAKGIKNTTSHRLLSPSKEIPKALVQIPVPTESAEQQSLMRWAAYSKAAYPELALLYHVPNEGKRSAATGGRMRAEGIKSGVPDLCLPVARGKYHGLYIELKRQRGGRISQNQSAWVEALNREGYLATVCFGWENAVEVITRYLKRSGSENENG